MKSNKLLIALTLCATIQSNISFGSDVLREEGPTPVNRSYWQQYAPQRVQDTTNYISQQATNLYNTVNSWSTRKKIAVAGSIITALAAIYNREQIMQWVSNTLNSAETNSSPTKTNSSPIKYTSHTTITKLDPTQAFKSRKEQYVEDLISPSFRPGSARTALQLRAYNEKINPTIVNDPAYQAAMEYLQIQGFFNK